MLGRLDKFHQTRPGYLVFGLVELAMAYGFVDWALDTGAWWWWLAALILLLGGVHNLAKVIWMPKK